MAPRRSGAIVNISSIAGLCGLLGAMLWRCQGRHRFDDAVDGV
jgi:hypothetical protein